MKSSIAKIKAIRQAIRTHVNWLVSAVVGSDYLTDSELKEVRSLKLKYEFIDDPYFAYYLGKKKAEDKPSKYKTLTWKEFLSYTRDRELSPTQLNSVRFARDSTAVHIKSFTDDLANDIFKDLQKTVGDTITEATLREIVQDETSHAVLENKSYAEFASALDARLKTKGKKDWEKIARTELHAAKQQGYVDTVVSREGIYSKSDGIDSKVSIITQPGACADCIKLYTNDGNPKIFILRDLISNGINTKHKKVNGIHIHWKPVVPPGHPSCYCQVMFIPPGYSWIDGKLTLTDKEELSKAFEGSMGPKKTPTPPSLPGVASPGQTGNVKNMAAPGQQGTGIEYEYWPTGRGKPPKEGGWESYKKKDGLLGHRRPKGSGGGGSTPEPEKDPVQTQAEAKAWGKTPKPADLVLTHLEKGAIVHQEELGDAAGVTESWRVTIEGNGRGIMKPPAFSTGAMAFAMQAGLSGADGAGSCPVGTGHIREKAAFYAARALGVDKIPPTVTRSHEGQPVSIQAWSETKGTISSKIAKGEFGDVSEFPLDDQGNPYITNETKYIMSNLSPEKKEKFLAGAAEATALAIVINHNDQHFGNVLIDDDMNFSFIDNSFSLGNSTFGNKVQIHCELHNLGHKVKVPDHMMERFATTTFNDLKRSMGDHIEDWAVGQTFLRMKYVEYLQKTEGHLDYEKFRPVLRAGASDETLTKLQKQHDYDPKYVKSIGQLKGAPHSYFWSGSESEQADDYANRKENGLLSHQMFDSFGKQWIIDGMQKPEGHPDRIAAEELAVLGVFMDPAGGFTLNPQDYRAEGKHRAYEDSIKPGYPPANVKAAVTSGQQASSTKGTTPSQKRPKKSPVAPPKSSDAKTAQKPEIPVGNQVAPVAYAHTHLVLDLDEDPKALAKLQDQDVDNAFDSIMMGDSDVTSEDDEDIIDLTNEIEALALFDKSIKQERKTRLYIS